MKLLGRDLSPQKVMAYVADRLEARGLGRPADAPLSAEGVEPRVDPLSFNLSALEANADATVGLPVETHRDGVAGRAVVLAKRVFRAAGQVLINEALGRQRVFNGHVRDSYAQLAAEVVRLRARVAELEAHGPVEPARAASAPAPVAPPAPPSLSSLAAAAARAPRPPPPAAVVASAVKKPRGAAGARPSAPPPPPPPPPRAPGKGARTTRRGR